MLMVKPNKSKLIVRPAKGLFLFFVVVALVVNVIVLLDRYTPSSAKIEIIAFMSALFLTLLYVGWTKNILTLTESELTFVNLTRVLGFIKWSKNITLPLSDIRQVEIDPTVFEVTDQAGIHYIMKMSVFTKGSILKLADALKQRGVNTTTHFH